MQQRELIHRLLHLALTEIQEIGSNIGDEFFVRLAGLLAPLPLRLEQVAQGRGSYREVMIWLEHRGQRERVSGWVDRAHRYFRQRQARSVPSRSDAAIPAESELSREREQLYYFLHLALVDLRVRAHETHEDRAFCLADVFHNVPLGLNLVHQGTGSYEEIRSSIHERARREGCEEWLNQAIQSQTSSSQHDAQS